MKPKPSQGLPSEEERRTQIALFRYTLIAPLLDHPLERGEIAAHLRAVAAQTHHIPFSSRTTLHEETIWRYLARYRAGGFEALGPQVRTDAGRSRRIPEEIIAKAIALRQEVPSRSANTLIQILQRDPAYPPDLAIATRTLQDILHARGITRQGLVGQAKAFRRFEREAPNVLWQGDMLVGPYLPDAERPGKYRRTAIFCFIDDYSRLVPYGEFFLEENLPRLERVLKVAILRRGLPERIYVDNGKVYVSTQLAAACATLAVRLVHSTPYTPQHPRQDRALLRDAALPVPARGRGGGYIHPGGPERLLPGLGRARLPQGRPLRDGPGPPRTLPRGPDSDQGPTSRPRAAARGVPVAGEAHGHPYGDDLPPGQSLLGGPAPCRPAGGAALRPLRALRGRGLGVRPLPRSGPGREA